jgi:hypothetical protein
VKQKCSWRVVRRAEKCDLYKIVHRFGESRFCSLFCRGNAADAEASAFKGLLSSIA